MREFNISDIQSLPVLRYVFKPHAWFHHDLDRSTVIMKTQSIQSRLFDVHVGLCWSTPSLYMSISFHTWRKQWKWLKSCSLQIHSFFVPLTSCRSCVVPLSSLLRSPASTLVCNRGFGLLVFLPVPVDILLCSPVRVLS